MEESSKTKIKIAYVSIFSVLTAVGAFVSVPLFPVPFTLQTVFVVLSCSLSRTDRLTGPLSQLFYIAIGLMGLPIFAGARGGPGIILSPTFGYLAMFPIASYIASFAPSVRKRWPLTILAFSAAILAIYVGGEAYLYFYSGHILGKQMTLKAVMLAGVLPFLPLDALKIAVLMPVHLRLSKILAKRD